MPMNLGLALPVLERSTVEPTPLPWTTVAAWARRAEALGFESLWVPDGAVDPFVVLAALARITGRPRLGTLVLDAERRHPAVAAKALTTLDVVSAGRLVAGFGAGPGAGPGSDPGAGYLAETCQVVAGMFEGGPFTFAGAHVHVAGARNLPRPHQRPRPPIWVGGRATRLIEVAARHADGWNAAWTSTPDDYRRRLAVLEAACDRAGRDPASVTRSLALHALVGEDDADVARRFDRLREEAPAGRLPATTLDDWRGGNLVGTAADVDEQLDGWSALGVDTLVLSPAPFPFAEPRPEDVEILAAACSIEPHGRTRGA
jgi:alkanesulfonate monooxygenase SsuD/methylene tetrahydromethanopterin reductase-like flavin-dependent oxidoreductase (luciferase family)